MPPISILAWETLDEEAQPSAEAMRLQLELQQHSTDFVGISIARTISADPNGFLVFENGFTELPEWITLLPEPNRRDVLARTFLFGGIRSPSIFTLLEQYKLCGGVDSLSHRLWGSEVDHSIIGLRPLAERLGVLPKPSVLNQSEHYAMYTSRTATSLPQAIVEYFDAVARERGL